MKSNSKLIPIVSVHKKSGRPLPKFTKKQHEQAELLAGLGLKHEEIALVMELNVKTMERYFSRELTRGIGVADAKVGRNLFRIATGDTPQAAAAAMFWQKVRRRWHEVHRVIHGFDPSVVQEFVSRVVSTVKRIIPETCPHCKTNLQMRPALAKELTALSERLSEQMQPSEIVMGPASEDAAEGGRG